MPNKGRRTRNLFDPKSKKSYCLSRSKIDLFVECPRCFYLDRKLGVARPPGFPFTLNVAVDTLLKKEFDIHRAKGSRHPLMETYGIDAIPLAHEKLDEWRENFKGIQYLHKPTNLIITGAIDDLWIDSKRNFIIVDYKATSKNGEVVMDQAHHDIFRRQVEMYQWLFRRNGFNVSDTAYFVYANGKKDRKAFDGRLEFEVEIIPHQGDDSWVGQRIIEAHECLMSEKIPQASEECEFCRYREITRDIEGGGRLF
jgi:CRISPR/Cas system-associated exonuclease Cas4 (RecB family)